MKTLPLVLVLGLASPAVAADAVQEKMAAYVRDSVMAWAADPAVLAAVQAGNAAHQGLSEEDILALDTRWRDEVGHADTPTITAVSASAVSDFLRQKMKESNGAIVEVILMDDKGLNVGVTDVTSDYWQGDEDKFLKTYPAGAGAMDLGDVELDESSQTYEAQVSFTIVDPATGAPIGAMTVGLNADAF